MKTPAAVFICLTSEIPVQQPFQPKLHMTDADFLSITRNGRLCDEEGGLGEREFELVMREQVSPGLQVLILLIVQNQMRAEK